MRIRIAGVGGIAKIAVVLIMVVVIQGVAGLWLGPLRYFDLPLVFCVFYGLAWGRPAAAVAMGTAVGLMQDSLSGVALGTNGFSKTLVGFLAASSGGRFDVDQIATRGFALILFTLADGVLTASLGALSGSQSHWRASFFLDWLIAAVVNAVLGLILFRFFEPSNDVEE